MLNLFKLEINQPCHENWEQMTPTTVGSYCQSCQKQVIDFSNMTEPELVAYFRDLNTDKLCGRFTTNQVAKMYNVNDWYPNYINESQISFEIPVRKLENNELKLRLPPVLGKNIIKKIAVAALLISCTTSSYAQGILLEGKIVNAEDNAALPGVNIFIKGKNKGITTDSTGTYKLQVDATDMIVISMIGMETILRQADKVAKVESLTMDVQLLDEVKVKGVAISKYSYVTGGVGVKSCAPKEIKNNFIIEIAINGNPSKANEFKVVPKIKAKSIFYNKEDYNWLTNNAFENIETVIFYNENGNTMAVQWQKINNNELNISLKSIPNGLYFVRVIFSNSAYIEPQVAVAKVVVRN